MPSSKHNRRPAKAQRSKSSRNGSHSQARPAADETQPLLSRKPPTYAAQAGSRASGDDTDHSTGRHSKAPSTHSTQRRRHVYRATSSHRRTSSEEGGAGEAASCHGPSQPPSATAPSEMPSSVPVGYEEHRGTYFDYLSHIRRHSSHPSLADQSPTQHPSPGRGSEEFSAGGPVRHLDGRPPLITSTFPSDPLLRKRTHPKRQFWSRAEALRTASQEEERTTTSEGHSQDATAEGATPDDRGLVFTCHPHIGSSSSSTTPKDAGTATSSVGDDTSPVTRRTSPDPTESDRSSPPPTISVSASIANPLHINVAGAPPTSLRYPTHSPLPMRNASAVPSTLKPPAIPGYHPTARRNESGHLGLGGADRSPLTGPALARAGPVAREPPQSPGVQGRFVNPSDWRHGETAPIGAYARVRSRLTNGYLSDTSGGPVARPSSAVFVPLSNHAGSDCGRGLPNGVRARLDEGPDWKAIHYFSEHGELPPHATPRHSHPGPSYPLPVNGLDGEPLTTLNSHFSELWDDVPDDSYVDDEAFLDPSYRFTFFSPNFGTIRARELFDLQTDEHSLEDLLTSAKGCFWIDVLAPEPRDMALLARFFKIHPLTAEDILTQDAREKCETFRNYYFTSFRTFEMDPSNEGYMDPLSMYMVVFKEGILSFHNHTNPHPRNVLRRIQQMMDVPAITPDWINYALIDDITDHFQPVMRLVEHEVDTVDELVLILNESEQSDMLRRIGLARKTVISLLRLLTSKPDVVRSLMKRFESQHSLSGTSLNMNDTGLYLGDILDHLVTMLQNSNHYEAILSRSHANYLAQISFEITQASNRTNDVVAKLSALASILVPLNLVTGK
ncbi:CorA metal ion transporter [Tieghemiomyces parasiticus]|uniref:CorA metal ion transporter n=1 Tax=Tieghemiomyces parasiticus TaxID=78921 RepID=A0A9W8AJJ6_9FUNG|nr:CorA metal ion transporter [Tieghemiomyces parasiticus]